MSIHKTGFPLNQQSPAIKTLLDSCKQSQARLDQQSRIQNRNPRTPAISPPSRNKAMETEDDLIQLSNRPSHHNKDKSNTRSYNTERDQANNPFLSPAPYHPQSSSMNPPAMIPDAIPTSNYEKQRRRVEMDLDMTMDTFSGDSMGTESGLEQGGRKPAARREMERIDEWTDDEMPERPQNRYNDSGFHFSDPSFDQHARRTGLFQASGHYASSSSPSSSTLSTNSINLEYPRTAPILQSQADQHDFGFEDRANKSFGGADEEDFESDFERSMFIGASPVSTAGHHASKLTIGAGVFLPPKQRNRELREEKEYDPDRELGRLVEAARKSSKSERQKENQPGSSQRVPSSDSNLKSIFSEPLPAPPSKSAFPTSNSHPNVNSRYQNLHKPVQPSPLRTHAISPVTTSAASSERAHGQSLGALNPTTKANMAGEPSIRQQEQRKASDAQSARVRVVSATNSQKGHPSASRHSLPSKGSFGGVMSGTSTMGDLTGLTGMLATPAKGLKHKGMREDGEKRAEGAEIEEAFHKMENDLKTLRTESANARAKIQDLEEELQVMQTRHVQAVSEAESGKRREKDLELESERYKQANRELEALVADLRQQTAALDGALAARKQQFDKLKRQAEDQVNRSIDMDGSRVSLRRVLAETVQRVDQLERNVVELQEAVKGINHRAEGGMRVAMAAEGPASAPVPETRTQMDEGRYTAAYDAIRREEAAPPAPKEAPAKKTVVMQPPSPTTEEDVGSITPSPPSRTQNDSRSLSVQSAPVAGTSGRRKRSSKPEHHARSEQPQQDPSASPFPAIRGDRLESDFFASPTRPELVPKRRTSAPGPAARSGARQTTDTDSQPRPRKSRSERRHEEPQAGEQLSSGKQQPQTKILKVLREIEDDYQHYLSIYTDLAEQYRKMSPLSTKRRVLAEHLKEVIDIMEQKADQVMNLTDVLEVRDKPYMVPVANAIKASKARLNFPDGIQAMRRDVDRACVE